MRNKGPFEKKKSQKKHRYLLAGIVGLFILSGCGGKGKIEIALITNGETIEDQSNNQSAWEGIKQFSQVHEKTYGFYQPAQKNTGGYEEAISQAINRGAKVIICPGPEFEVAVYDMQKEDLSIKYLILDGVPHAKDSEKEKLRGNTQAILFTQEQAGFLAGYGAVMEGYTSLGFFGGEKDKETIAYGSGFVQGINAAAKELQLDAEQVKVFYQYYGSTVLSPEVTAIAESWYEQGCEVIFGCDAPLLSGIGKAAKEKGKFIISADGMVEPFSESVLTYVASDYGKVVQQQLETIEEGTYDGGTKFTVGIESSSVGLDMDNSAFQKFTKDQYTKVCQDINAGKYKITSKGVIKNLEKYDIKNVTIAN